MNKEKLQTVLKRTITGIILGALFWTSFAYLPYWIFSLVLLAIMIQIIFFEWRNLFDIKSLTFWLLMPFYPILPFMLLIYMNHIPQYRNLLFILFIIVSAHDTGAYIVGTLFGKYPIAPKISPGKSWEGFLAGCFAAYIGLSLALWELEVTKSVLFILGFSVGVSVLTIAGDLFESWLKRRAHIKDTGNILPGHGGFLDRFDGILFTVFFFYFFRDWLVKLFF